MAYNSNAGASWIDPETRLPRMHPRRLIGLENRWEAHQDTYVALLDRFEDAGITFPNWQLEFFEAARSTLATYMVDEGGWLDANPDDVVPRAPSSMGIPYSYPTSTIANAWTALGNPPSMDGWFFSGSTGPDGIPPEFYHGFVAWTINGMYLIECTLTILRVFNLDRRRWKDKRLA